MPLAPLRQRIRDQSLTPTIVATALRLQQDINRTIDGPPGGVTYSRIEAFLDEVEENGYLPGSITPPPDPRPGCTKALGGVCGCAICGRERVEANARLKEWQEADRERVLAERAAYTARAIQLAADRITHGRELQTIREDAGLTLRELGAMLNVDFSLLGRIEKGHATGSKIAEINAGYSALTALGTKTKKGGR